MRIADLADDDLIADARLRQRFDIGRAKRLALFNALDRLRALARERLPLLLIHRVADNPAGQGANRAADERAGARVVAGAADDCSRTRADGATRERAGCSAVRLAFRRVTSR